jgi:hypothetical protein
MRTCTRVAAALTAATVLFATPARADDAQGDAFRKLSAQWWQWALSIPAVVNPLADATGQFCMIGQRGGVWFLAGSMSSQPASRTCSVPEGVPLFFPVINSVWINTPACDGLVLSVAEVRANAAKEIDGASGLAVLLDNRPVTTMRRVRSEIFYTVFPQANLFGADCLFPTPQSPSADDGYYVQLEGLSAGQHHLSIQGTTSSGFSVDVFYTLNVVGVVTKDKR